MLSSRVSTRRSGAARYRAPMPDQLRVAILGSGRSLHTKRWARRLAERGHEVHIYTVFPEPVEGVHVHDVLGRRLPKGTGVRMLWRRRHLRRTLHAAPPRHRPDPEPVAVGRVGLARRAAAGCAGSVGLRRAGRAQDRSAEARLAQTLLREADAITVNSDGLKQGVTDLGVPAELVHRIGWGVDTRGALHRGARPLADRHHLPGPAGGGLAAPAQAALQPGRDHGGDPAGAAARCPTPRFSSWPTASRPTPCAIRPSSSASPSRCTSAGSPRTRCRWCSPAAS